METKINEIINSTSSLDEMKGQFLAKRLLRTWKEDFVDEDSGETLQIERNEILFDKGTEIDQDVLTQINFYMQTGDIKEVLISNQQRIGTAVSSSTSVYSITICYGTKKKTYYLYSDSVELAIKIITDYLEQKIQGAFSFSSIKELKFSTLIPENEDDEDVEKDFYHVELEVLREDSEAYEQTYILKAKDAEEAKENIEKFIISMNEEHNRTQNFTTVILSAKTISCNNIVDYNFSKQYLEQ